MDLADLAELAARQIPAVRSAAPQYVSPLRHLRILRHHKPTVYESAIYKPLLCLILQGGKVTTLGADAYPMGVGECLLISHDLPVVARISKAPYLALLFDLDLDLLRELYDAIAGASSAAPAEQPRSLEVVRSDPALVDALARYVTLASSPTDATVLAPLVSREIHYRLAMAPFGGMLRDLLRHDSHASAIARALSQLRRDFRASVEIPALAKSVGMSASAFHKHFKSVTASSPLQYQKGLRLLEARRILRTGAESVSSAAFSVGYESLTQFSREYSRKFGVSPRQDLPT